MQNNKDLSHLTEKAINADAEVGGRTTPEHAATEQDHLPEEGELSQDELGDVSGGRLRNPIRYLGETEKNI
jgi:hypothetical protein